MTAWCFHQTELDRALDEWEAAHLQGDDGNGRSPEEVAEARKIITGFLHSEPMRKGRFDEGR